MVRIALTSRPTSRSSSAALFCQPARTTAGGLGLRLQLGFDLPDQRIAAGAYKRLLQRIDEPVQDLPRRRWCGVRKSCCSCRPVQTWNTCRKYTSWCSWVKLPSPSRSRRALPFHRLSAMFAIDKPGQRILCPDSGSPVALVPLHLALHAGEQFRVNDALVRSIDGYSVFLGLPPPFPLAFVVGVIGTISSPCTSW